MGIATATRPSTAATPEIAWHIDDLERGDFSALSSDGKTWYSANVFTGECTCKAAQFHPERPCRHVQAGRQSYWAELDATRRQRAMQQALRRGSRLSEVDLQDAPGWREYYAPLEPVA